MEFNYYLQELENILQKASERSHYPALKTLIDSATLGINTIIEKKGKSSCYS